MIGLGLPEADKGKEGSGLLTGEEEKGGDAVGGIKPSWYNQV